jgi:hypothetical protein
MGSTWRISNVPPYLMCGEDPAISSASAYPEALTRKYPETSDCVRVSPAEEKRRGSRQRHARRRRTTPNHVSARTSQHEERDRRGEAEEWCVALLLSCGGQPAAEGKGCVRCGRRRVQLAQILPQRTHALGLGGARCT